MIKNFCYLILFLFLTAEIIFPQNYTVKFIVITKYIPNSGKIFISGNDKKLGSWNPGRIQLKKSNDSTWSTFISFPEKKIIEFKFTRGTWQKEALNDDGSIPQNYVLKVNSDTTVLVKISKWKDQNEITRNFKGKVTGEVQYFRNITGQGIKQRDIIVWLPPGYKKDTFKRYPVLYMQDGQNLFDPKTSSFGVDWQADETTDSLIQNKIIAPFIIVGIYNTSDRSLEYTPTKKGIAYMKFIVTKLKPFIDSNFRTIPDRENTVVGGSSFGGTISFMLAWYYSNVFSKAVCFSPAFNVNGFDLTSEITKYKGYKKNIKFYIDNGGIGLDEQLQPGIDKMLKVLQNKGYKLNDDIFWYKDSTARHFEADWAKRFWRPLELFYGWKKN